MKDNLTQLYPNEKVGARVGNYAFAHSTSLPKHMLEHHAWASDNHEHPNMMISPLQAQFHVWMAKAVAAKRVLEIGCFVGFSALGWSDAVGTDGHVTTLEYSPEYAKVAQDAFHKYEVDNVEVIVGDAGESMVELAKKLEQPYDLIFIDADKVSYPKYLSLILSLSPISGEKTRMLRPGGLIMADNVLRRALIADASDDNPWSSELKQRGEKVWRDGDMKGLEEFNENLAKDGRMQTFLMPMFDGLGMAILKD